MSDDIELTPEEKMAFDNLPRDAAPSELLEERIVRALREDGTLRSSAGVVRRATSRRRGEVAGRPIRLWIAAGAAMAASLILFGSGVLAGQWMGARSTERIMLAVREQDNIQRAQRVQEAGSAYVSALVALAELRAAAGSGAGQPMPMSAAQAASEIQQGREVAMGALYAAALELARMSPGDTDVFQVVEILEQRRSQAAGIGRVRRTVWY